MEVTLHHFQGEALRSQKRFIALIAGTGGGKTYFGPIWLLTEVQKYPTDSFFVIAPTFPLFERTTLPEFMARFELHIGGVYREKKKRYEMSTGGIVYFGSADNPDSLEGGQVRAAWIDEAGQIKRASWQATQRRLGVKMGRCLLTTTPYGMGWLYTDFYKRWKNKDPDYDVIQFRSVDNPYYPRDEYERARRTMDSRTFSMRYKGQFKKLAGLIYPDFGPDNIVEPFKIPEGWKRWGGIDFGWNHPFVAMRLATDPNKPEGEIFIYEEYCQSARFLVDHAKKLDKNIQYYADPSAKQDRKELANQKVRIKPGNNDVDSGIELMGTLIKVKRLKVFKTCLNFLDEIEIYRRDEKDKVVKKDDDCMDSTRYALMSEVSLSKPKRSQVYA